MIFTSVYNCDITLSWTREALSWGISRGLHEIPAEDARREAARWIDRLPVARSFHSCRATSSCPFYRDMSD
jgi:hypothetical protein